MSSSAEALVTIINKRGLHARAAAKVCETARRFEAKITFSKDGVTVGARSQMALLMLGAGIGSEVRIAAEGADASEAVAAMQALVEARFEESE